jgi:predicted esterase YcpF (UPF0227 family)
MSLLLYLHGFNSSPDSQKARISADWFAEHAPEIEFFCPQLPPFANAAMHRLRTLMDDNRDRSIYLIGSSMGGFFATCLIEQHNLRGALINPAVSPGPGLQHWLGENANSSTGEKWVFEPAHIKEYLALDPGSLKRQNNYQVLLQCGDEVLDYRAAQKRYAGCSIILEDGGDHSFVHYEQHLAGIHQFLISN